VRRGVWARRRSRWAGLGDCLLQRGAKHANASAVTVSTGRRNGKLVVAIRDDGIGGAVLSDGSGLAGMSDRVAALGGSVTVASPPGGGTIVTAELPCE
jgi:signal transduction histidine kinase